MGKKSYLNQKFGRLMIIEEIYEKGKDTKARCICDCGNEVIVDRNSVVSGHTRSCGCLRKEMTIDRTRKSYVGQKFGRLTIIEEIFSENQDTQAVCICDCGNRIIVRRTNLITGHTKSCGCLHDETMADVKRKSYVGKKFGNLTILEEFYDGTAKVKVKCKCDCGNKITLIRDNVVSGNTLSCGCLKASTGEIHVSQFLTDNDIEFSEEYTFDDCRDKNVLPFDFAIFSDKGILICLIEYDGIQHFDPIEYFCGYDGFCQRKIHDNIKNKYCESHNIPLLRLPYTLTDDEIEKEIYEFYLSVETAGCA